MTAVHITHPDLPKAKPAVTTEAAFEKVWKGRGWKTLSADEAIAAERDLEEDAAAPTTAPATDATTPATKAPKTTGGQA